MKVHVRRSLLAAPLVAAAGLGVAACGGPAITSGTVIAKQYTPAHTSVYDEPVSCGKGCMSMVPVTQFHPASWQVEVKNSGNTAWLTVSAAQYSAVSIGTFFKQNQQ